MRPVFAFFGLFVTVLASAADPKDPRSLDVPAEKTAAAKALIAKLDDDDIFVRDKLTAELKAMGRDALPAMAEAMKGKLPERVARPLHGLLPDARRADFELRYPLFLADTERKYDHDLLGWNDLKAAAGDTKESRLLFADILADEPCRDMLVQALDPSEDGQQRFQRRWKAKRDEWYAEHRAGRQPKGAWPKAGDPIHWVPAALLADLLHDRDYDNGYRHGTVQAFLHETDEGKLVLIDKGRHGGVVRAFAKFWIERQTGRYGLRDGSSIVRYFKLDQSVEWGCMEKLFDLYVETEQPNGSFGYLASTRDPKYIARYRRLFDSALVHRSPDPDGSHPGVDVRDAALAMCVALSGQDPLDYGFTSVQTRVKITAESPQRYWSDNYYFAAGDGKTADEKRKAALMKWAEWEKANPDKIKAKVPDKK